MKRYIAAIILCLIIIGFSVLYSPQQQTSVQADHIIVSIDNLAYNIDTDGNKTYLSNPIQTNHIFDTLVFLWQGDDSVYFDVRIKENNNWTSWKKITREQAEQPSPFHTSDFIFAKNANTFQYKITIPAYSLLQNLQISYLGSPRNNDIPLTYANGFSIISRSQWGANENLQYTEGWTTAREEYCKKAPWVCVPLTAEKLEEYRQKKEDLLTNFPEEMKLVQTISQENGKNLFWERSYMALVKKIVVHHTGEYYSPTDNTGNEQNDSDIYGLTATDYQARIRSMYYYHTIVQGWGDIGYNFIVDPLGNIYEGRAGGDRVVGAHVAWNNEASIGVSLMGNYESMQPNTSSIGGLVKILSHISKKYNLDPVGTGYFRGKSLPTIIGHKDLAATACPGKNLYEKLGQIRVMTASMMKESSTTTSILGSVNDANNEYSAQYISTDIHDIQLPPTSAKTIRFRFKNTGTKTWEKTTHLEGCCSFDSTLDVLQSKKDITSFAVGMEQTIVQPGEIADFMVTFLSGYIEKMNLVTLTPVINEQKRVQSIIIPVSVTSPNYSYEFIKSQYPQSTLVFGEKTTGSVTLKNTGNITWVNIGENAIVLKPDRNRFRHTQFHPEDPTILATLQESEVKPGQMGTFSFDITAPSEEKVYNEYFTPFIKQVGYFSDLGMYFSFRVTPPKTSYLYQYNIVYNKSLLFTGKEEKTIAIELKNTDSRTWENLQNNNIKLFSYGLEGGTVSSHITFTKNSVVPGDTVTMFVAIQAPLTPGRYIIRALPRMDGINVLDRLMEITLYVQTSQISGELIKQNQETTVSNVSTPIHISLSIKNTGNIMWKKHEINIGQFSNRNTLSPLFHNSWIDPFKLATCNENTVAPGEIGTFDFLVSPQKIGSIEEQFKLGIKGCCWVTMNPIWIRVRGTNNTTTIAPTTIPSTTPSTSNVTSIYHNHIKVRLMFQPSDKKGTLSVLGNATITNGTQSFPVPMGTTPSIEIENDTITASFGEQKIRGNTLTLSPTNPNDIIKINNWTHYPEWDTNKQYNDNIFRGKITTILENGNLVFINELPFEDYLKGVAETANNTHYEKKKVMAILARTYALFYLLPEHRKFPGKIYDASDDPNIFQKYLGYGYELRSKEWIDALKETAGMVVTYNGKMIKTPYFSNSDGRTRSAEEVWGWKNTPYLISVPDMLCDEKVQKGHGVGLSGCGAEKAAQQGKKYDEIIKYYYDGVHIEKLN